ncbi:hypothetical protein SUGI_0294680 [Cryptomeria japonica]|uniref:very-long-chain aldehyde decarbonylase GL1-1 isoform X2 n=1 Tax=Cryptomeria japonica TaxID=3369 RepID=UPI002408E630|nr:very-long-chain aldehyde decarbonylase GL1-1 isoform X2 [Cryptomeria japonica]GLJ17033.1 hypothetical protein SUGI_0294680 [Cryptomeria japonica]
MKSSAYLAAWPWTNLGSLKYLLYGPLIAKAIHTNFYGENGGDNWCFHILLVSLLRCTICQIWTTYSNMYCLSSRHKICRKDAEFDQMDREWDWDNYIILQAFMAAAAHYYLPFLSNLPAWNAKGLLYVAILHMGPVEALYYWLHRAFHTDFLFKNYHSLHHASITLQPQTTGTATFLEHIVLTLIMAVPIVGAGLMGGASMAIIYIYYLLFDSLRFMGHCNVEMMPESLFRSVPMLRYLIYTPSYHSLHHTEMSTNYCLFMPLYDHLWGTLNSKSWTLQRSVCAGEDNRVPDFVFLAHIVDVLSSLHVRFLLRGFTATPFRSWWFLWPLWPVVIPVMFVMWIWAKPFVNTGHKLKGYLNHTWVVPRFGFQYFIPFAHKGINNLIEEAILSADKMGVKVISLAALNKNEALNGGGTLFVKRLPNLRVRVVHGNTLTAAVVIKEIKLHVKEVFLTGATSKLGRVIALYLSRKGVRVLMLTNSEERFKSIQKEAPPELQKFLVQVTKYEAGQNCKTWIVGKWIAFKEQRCAPPGTHFHQFVVPPIFELRNDCTYGKLVGMQLPDAVEELSTCEYKMSRRCVHACHAGGILHLLEGWEHHEVGAIDVDKIDVVWEAAMKHGFKTVE